MRIKDETIRCQFDARLTDFLLRYVEPIYNEFGEELVITSGSELGSHHSWKSLHWDGKAVDLRTRFFEALELPQVIHSIKEAAKSFCDEIGIPHNWIDIVVHSTHLHIEIQPKALV